MAYLPISLLLLHGAFLSSMQGEFAPEQIFFPKYLELKRSLNFKPIKIKIKELIFCAALI